MTTTIEPPVEEVSSTTSVEKPKAMVIDDAFDSEIHVDPAKYIDFYYHLDEEKQLEWFTKETGLVTPTPFDDLDSPNFKKYINDLFQARKRTQELQKILEVNLFGEIVSLKTDVDEICKNIANQEFDIKTINSVTDETTLKALVEKGEYQIIFLDYNLGNPGPDAVKNAREKAKVLYEACPAESKPIIILMSSQENVVDNLESFKKDLGIGNIVFRATPKNMLINDGSASLLVQAYKNESEHIHKLQKYITALKNAALSAFKEFKDDVDVLTIDDYSFIHNTTVMDQAHPLGDYLGWLYGSHWTNLLLRNPDLKTEKDNLDRLLVEKPSLHYSMPSRKILEIYMSALFEEAAGDISEHSMAGALLQGSKTKTIGTFPHLHLGDIFSDENNPGPLWMILNPQCDLERITEETSNNSVFLIPGELAALDLTKTEDQKTELMIVGNKEYRVLWKLKKVISIPIKDFFDWKKNNKLTRKFILRLPFALEIQQAFTSLVSRVGLPVSPPFSYPIHIQVLIKDGDQMSVLLESKDNYGFLAITSTPTKIVRFTLQFALDFKNKLFSKIEELNKIEVASEKPLDKKLAQVRTGLSELLEKFNIWYFETRQTELPPKGKRKELLNGYIDSRQDYENVENKHLPLVIINFVTDEHLVSVQGSTAANPISEAKDPGAEEKTDPGEKIGEIKHEEKTSTIKIIEISSDVNEDVENGDVIPKTEGDRPIGPVSANRNLDKEKNKVPPATDSSSKKE